MYLYASVLISTPKLMFTIGFIYLDRHMLAFIDTILFELIKPDDINSSKLALYSQTFGVLLKENFKHKAYGVFLQQYA